MSKGQKFRYNREKRLGIENKGAKANRKKRDAFCISLAPIFLANSHKSLRKLSLILAEKGILNRNGKPLDPHCVSNYRKRINEMIEEGIIDKPQP